MLKTNNEQTDIIGNPIESKSVDNHKKPSESNGKFNKMFQNASNELAPLISIGVSASILMICLYYCFLPTILNEQQIEMSKTYLVFGGIGIGTLIFILITLNSDKESLKQELNSTYAKDNKWSIKLDNMWNHDGKSILILGIITLSNCLIMYYGGLQYYTLSTGYKFTLDLTICSQLLMILFSIYVLIIFAFTSSNPSEEYIKAHNNIIDLYKKQEKELQYISNDHDTLLYEMCSIFLSICIFAHCVSKGILHKILNEQELKISKFATKITIIFLLILIHLFIDSHSNPKAFANKPPGEFIDAYVEENRMSIKLHNMLNHNGKIMIILAIFTISSFLIMYFGGLQNYTLSNGYKLQLEMLIFTEVLILLFISYIAWLLAFASDNPIEYMKSNGYLLSKIGQPQEANEYKLIFDNITESFAEIYTPYKNKSKLMDIPCNNIQNILESFNILSHQLTARIESYDKFSKANDETNTFRTNAEQSKVNANNFINKIYNTYIYGNYDVTNPTNETFATTFESQCKALSKDIEKIFAYSGVHDTNEKYPNVSEQFDIINKSFKIIDMLYMHVNKLADEQKQDKINEHIKEVGSKSKVNEGNNIFLYRFLEAYRDSKDTIKKIHKDVRSANIIILGIDKYINELKRLACGLEVFNNIGPNEATEDNLETFGTYETRFDDLRTDFNNYLILNEKYKKPKDEKRLEYGKPKLIEDIETIMNEISVKLTKKQPANNRDKFSNSDPSSKTIKKEHMEMKRETLSKITENEDEFIESEEKLIPCKITNKYLKQNKTSPKEMKPELSQSVENPFTQSAENSTLGNPVVELETELKPEVNQIKNSVKIETSQFGNPEVKTETLSEFNQQNTTKPQRELSQISQVSSDSFKSFVVVEDIPESLTQEQTEMKIPNVSQNTSKISDKSNGSYESFESIESIESFESIKNNQNEQDDSLPEVDPNALESEVDINALESEDNSNVEPITQPTNDNIKSPIKKMTDGIAEMTNRMLNVTSSFFNNSLFDKLVGYNDKKDQSSNENSGVKTESPNESELNEQESELESSEQGSEPSKEESSIIAGTLVTTEILKEEEEEELSKQGSEFEPSKEELNTSNAEEPSYTYNQVDLPSEQGSNPLIENDSSNMEVEVLSSEVKIKISNEQEELELSKQKSELEPSKQESELEPSQEESDIFIENDSSKIEEEVKSEISNEFTDQPINTELSLIEPSTEERNTSNAGEQSDTYNQVDLQNKQGSNPLIENSSNMEVEVKPENHLKKTNTQIKPKKPKTYTKKAVQQTKEAKVEGNQLDNLLKNMLKDISSEEEDMNNELKTNEDESVNQSSISPSKNKDSISPSKNKDSSSPSKNSSQKNNSNKKSQETFKQFNPNVNPNGQNKSNNNKKGK